MFFDIAEAQVEQNNEGGENIIIQPMYRLRLVDIVKYLKKQGFALDNTFVSYYSSVFSAYINCN